ncbi:MAG TPA: cellulase family glycosylhydrolase [Candidatus Hydrogenedentes bacterium]|nr:cellulase family glycosylhydrolase [Candidatus Hydrogenedentota bacterium]
MRNVFMITMLLPFFLLAGCLHFEGNDIGRFAEVDDVHPELRMKPIPQGLGVNIHFYQGNEKDLAMIEASGMGIIRMDISWDGVEKVPGVYDFSQYDFLIADMEARGVRILFIIDYGNTLYDEGLAPCSDAGRQASARFCAALAERYAGKSIIWELWNEPNLDHFWKPKPDVDAYMAWCHAVAPAIRQGDPDACIIAPAVSRVDRDFLRECFKRGLLELVDGISVHPYRSGEHGPETALKEYRALEKMIDEMMPAGRGPIPVISGEWGYTSKEISPELQGKYLARQWLANLSAGIPISIWYDWHEDGQDPEEREHHFGTVAWDYAPKPAYIAMTTLTKQLEGYLLAGRLHLGNDEEFAVLFRKAANDWKLALWTTGKSHQMRLPEGLRLGAGTDWLGNALEPDTGNTCPVTDAPAYYILDAPPPKSIPYVGERAR